MLPLIFVFKNSNAHISTMCNTHLTSAQSDTPAAAAKAKADAAAKAKADAAAKAAAKVEAKVETAPCGCIGCEYCLLGLHCNSEQCDDSR